MPREVGAVQEVVSIKTDMSERALINIPITGQVAARAKIRPESILLGKQAPRTEAQVQVQVDDEALDTDQLNVRIGSDEWAVRSFKSKHTADHAFILFMTPVLRIPAINDIIREPAE